MSLESILTEHSHRHENVSQLMTQLTQQISVGDVIVFVGTSTHLRRILLQTLKVHNDSVLLVVEVFYAGCYVTPCSTPNRQIFVHRDDIQNYLSIDVLLSKISEVAGDKTTTYDV